MDFSLLLANYPYVFAVFLFSLGWLIMLTQSNLIKKVIGVNIMENGVFLFYLAVGNIRGAEAPLVDPENAGVRLRESLAVGLDPHRHRGLLLYHVPGAQHHHQDLRALRDPLRPPAAAGAGVARCISRAFRSSS
jgi:multisubunit Na+/H+ antiporter MnhC subunit